MYHSGFSDKSGFTLVEVMIASAIFSVAIMATFTAFNASLVRMDNARTTTVVSQALRDEIERVRSLNWATIGGLSAEEVLSSDSVLNGNADLIAKGVAITRTIQTEGSDTEAYRITVKAEWEDNSGIIQERQLVSIYAKDGLYDYYYYLNPSS